METKPSLNMPLVLGGAAVLLIIFLLISLFPAESVPSTSIETINTTVPEPTEESESIDTPADTIPETNLFEAETNPYEGYKNPFE